MSQVQQITVAAEEAGQRLDRWFRQRFPQVTQGRLEKLLRKGEVRVDGKRAKSAHRIEAGETVRIPPLPDPETARPASDRPGRVRLSAEAEADLLGRVLYRDASVIALDKPAGLAVQGGSGQSRHLDGMLDALRFGSGERPRLVHRLDKDTAGVLLLARNAASARALTAAFRGKTTQKVYWALVRGVPEERRGLIDLPLAKVRSALGDAVAPAGEDGKAAQTLYRVVESYRRDVAWLVLMPLTGRTHQLRVHCAAMGTPIVGDGKYGGRDAFPAKLDLPKSMHLLARELALPHPDDGTTLRTTAPLPAHMAESWKKLGFDERKGEAAFEALLAYAEGISHSPGQGHRSY
ncbi:RluA family pseudouridine synthase [Pelagibius litoralis]|uniref:Pseudouridine synthase n=1 Tax=Pelagibius litoralis TaxID=374515 RepID=A0A967KGF7_9PROT|nr:RluA family pseudouridine synthase [Pelagibius litoralis]NIA72120.1 RluA family pseudouridine synthase [Pelagibius litoralis]